MKISDKFRLMGFEWTIADSFTVAVPFCVGCVAGLFGVVGNVLSMWFISYGVLKYEFPGRTSTEAILSMFMGNLFMSWLVYHGTWTANTIAEFLGVGLILGPVCFFGKELVGSLRKFINKKLVHV